MEAGNIYSPGPGKYQELVEAQQSPRDKKDIKNSCQGVFKSKSPKIMNFSPSATDKNRFNEKDTKFIEKQINEELDKEFQKLLQA